MSAFPFLRQTPEGVYIQVHVQPKAARSAVEGLHRQRLKIRIKAPPVEGRANEECVRFLAKFFGVSKSRMELVQGLKSRQKTLRLHGASVEELETVLLQKGLVIGDGFDSGKNF